jgi:ubiquinone/menaquinone biosynthesis C-methylase UbiE
MQDKTKYAAMQQAQYDNEASQWSLSNLDPVVGSFEQHTKWQDYFDFLFQGIDTPDKIALDFGCGPGRCIVQFANLFKQIDGIDISKTNLDNAKTYISKYNLPFTPNLFKNNGIDIANIQDNTYDIIFSTIAMQHIAVYDIRYNLFSEFFRALKPGGYICIQMGYGSRHPQSVSYFANFYDAQTTNGSMDVRIENAEDLINDLDQIGFCRISYDLRPTGPGDSHSQWIYFRAKKPNK